jgi:hypothetical protein
MTPPSYLYRVSPTGRDLQAVCRKVRHSQLGSGADRLLGVLVLGVNGIVEAADGGGEFW